MKSDVFRFSINRTTEKANLGDDGIIKSAPSDLTVRLGKARQAESSPLGEMRKVARAYVDTDANGNTDYVSQLSDLDPAFDGLDDATPDDPDVLKKLADIGKKSSDEALAGWIARVDDSLTATIVQEDRQRGDAVVLDNARRLLAVIEKTREAAVDSTQARGIFARTLALPNDVFPLPASDKHAVAAKGALEERRKQRDAATENQDSLVEKLASNHLAVRELRAAYEDDHLDGLKKGTQMPRAAAPAGGGSGGGLLSRLFGWVQKSGSIQPAASTRLGVLSEDRANSLSESTKLVLARINVTASDIHVPHALRALETSNASMGKALYRGGSNLRAVNLAGSYTFPEDAFNNTVVADWDLHVPGACPLPTAGEDELDESTVPAGVGTFQSLGVSELLVVKQQLLRYEKSEIAHIENVMATEERDRQHRVLTRTETFELEEFETVEESEQDLSTTERFELQTESQRTIKEDSSRDAGVTVSGSYGPSVDFTANAGFTSSKAKSKAASAATSHARDITERSVHRIQERVRRERSTLSINEIEVINTHGFLNRDVGATHISGIYRWVDKVYDAQVYNYGKRELIEVMIPEPAALYRHMQTSAPMEGITVDRPMDPGYCTGKGDTFEPLEPKHMNSVSAMFWASVYNVSGVTPPPPELQILGVALATKTEEEKPKDAQADNSLKVPAGYVAKRGVFEGNKVVMSEDGELQNADLAVYVGRHYMPPASVVDLNNETDTVPIAILTAGTPAFAGNVEVECERTREHLEEWQLETYNQIMNAYEERRAAYDAAIAEQGLFDLGPTIEGRNPAINRQVEQREIKRATISQITGQHFDDFDAMRKAFGEHSYPQADTSESDREGQYIRFIEQAFEWENMQYLFYPYFWGRKSDWPKVNQLTDNDPVFEAFLQAGACRVNLPVRPGFEAAVNAFLSTGTLAWNIDESNASVVNEEPFISIAEEMKSQQGAIDVKSDGTVSVTQGQTTVTGTDTAFSEDDVRREITIEGETYLVKVFTSETGVELDRPYEGEDATDVDYVIGAKAVGVPWTLRIPTSLVILQETSELPVFPETEE